MPSLLSTLPPPSPHVQMCASDMVYSSTALMEDVDRHYSEAFLIALEAVSRFLLMTIEGLEGGVPLTSFWPL